MPRRVFSTIVALAAAFGVAVASAQITSIWVQRDHPAIQYSTRSTRDAIVRLNESLEKGSVALEFDSLPRGYLASVLKAFDIPVSSQTLVFSENSLQREHISMGTPRAVYFNDTVAVGWAKGADTIEATVLDATQGVQFYTIRQVKQPTPKFARRADCLQCHLLPQTHGVPGLLTMSVLPLSDNQNEYAQGWEMDHGTPMEDRWGGWYVTGAQVPTKHLGNVPVLHVPTSYVRATTAPVLPTASGAFDTSAYLTPHSDVVALMVLNHQTRMSNLLTRLGWQARIALHGPAKSGALPQEVRDTAFEVVDYMLFVDEAPMPSAVKGASAFTTEFPATGPRDKKGRSLRDLDLTRRLFRYPCSYMIYNDAFDGLPAAAKALVYERMWQILSGAVKNADYSKLTATDRQAILEILRETKKDLPAYFTAAAAP
jgi:hypothetical protein